MRMFDSVYHRCSCGGAVEWQSKVGECLLLVFSPDLVPPTIASDINEELSQCYECGKKYRISTKIPKQEIQMIVEEVK